MSLLPPNSPIPAIVTILAIATILTFFLQSGMKSIRNVDFSIVSETRREASVSESGKDTDAFSVTDIQDENVLPVRDSEPSLEKPLLPPSQPTLRRNAPKNRTASEGFVNKNFTSEGSASEDSPNDVIHASSRYAGCSEMDIALSNGQVWASCNV
ncbi:MAG: hypothetical protein QG650_484 [Patescibacteria group bacterium]|nr:hypothetical protein [Patescibacteria group bacterium]